MENIFNCQNSKLDEGNKIHVENNQSEKNIRSLDRKRQMLPSGLSQNVSLKATGNVSIGKQLQQLLKIFGKDILRQVDQPTTNKKNDDEKDLDDFFKELKDHFTKNQDKVKIIKYDRENEESYFGKSTVKALKNLFRSILYRIHGGYKENNDRIMTEPEHEIDINTLIKTKLKDFLIQYQDKMSFSIKLDKKDEDNIKKVIEILQNLISQVFKVKNKEPTTENGLFAVSEELAASKHHDNENTKTVIDELIDNKDVHIYGSHKHKKRRQPFSNIAV